MIMGVTHAHLGTNLVSFRTFRCPLFPKSVNGHELFFAFSYREQALKPGQNKKGQKIFQLYRFLNTFYSWQLKKVFKKRRS